MCLLPECVPGSASMERLRWWIVSAASINRPKSSTSYPHFGGSIWVANRYSRP